MTLLHFSPDPTAQDLAPEARRWAALVGDLLRLSRIYHHRVDHRRMLRCETAMKSLETVLRLHAPVRSLSLRRILSEARALASQETEDGEALQEAAAWWRVCRTSCHLSLQVGLEGSDPDLALRLGDLHRHVREVIACVYPDTPGDELIRGATGDPEGEDTGEDAALQGWAERFLPAEDLLPVPDPVLEDPRLPRAS